jgi:hypothetical protein
MAAPRLAIRLGIALDLDFETRARDLVSRMTVAEKVSQLTKKTGNELFTSTPPRGPRTAGC